MFTCLPNGSKLNWFLPVFVRMPNKRTQMNERPDAISVYKIYYQTSFKVTITVVNNTHITISYNQSYNYKHMVCTCKSSIITHAWLILYDYYKKQIIKVWKQYWNDHIEESYWIHWSLNGFVICELGVLVCISLHIWTVQLLYLLSAIT